VTREKFETASAFATLIRWSFAISEDAVTFWEFARLFRDGLGSANALFLDGSISSLYTPALHRSDTLFPMGPIIAAFERK
jgi:prepilin-type processing-associated H-X9-DG protein